MKYSMMTVVVATNLLLSNVVLGQDQTTENGLNRSAKPSKSGVEKAVSSVIQTPTGTREILETRIGSVESIDFDQDPRAVQRFWISHDGSRFAREVEFGAKVSVDGQLFDHPIKEGSFVFSPDSLHFSYVETADKCEHLIVDGVRIGAFATIHLPLRFSPNSQHVACFATKLGDEGHVRCVVIDGNAGESDGSLGSELGFSSDSKSVFYGVSKDSKNQMVQRNVERGSELKLLAHGPAKLKENFFFGPQGQLGYIAQFGDQKLGVIYDGHDDENRLQDIRMQNIVVSRDGKRVAYVGDCSPIKNVAVHQGIRGTEFNPFENGRIVDSTIQISPDGRHVAYVVEIDRMQYCVVDGIPGPKYELIDVPEFSPDSNHLSYIAMKGKSPVVVVDGKESMQYAMVGQPEFTQDGKNHAYYAELGGRQFMVLNGKKGSDYDRVHKPEFNESGTKLIYAASRKDEHFLVVNGRKQKSYGIAGALEYLAKGERFAYLAMDSEDREMIVVDQSEGNRYDRILTKGSKAIYVTGPDRFHYLAVKRNELFLVKEQLR